MKHEFKHNFLKRVPISKRFFLLTLVVSILPILIIGLFCYTTTKHSISRLSSAYNERILHALQSNIRLNFQNYIQVADEIMLSSSVRNALPVYDSLEPDEKYDVVMDILSEIRSKFPELPIFIMSRLSQPKIFLSIIPDSCFWKASHGTNNLKRLKIVPIILCGLSFLTKMIHSLFYHARSQIIAEISLDISSSISVRIPCQNYFLLLKTQLL